MNRSTLMAGMLAVGFSVVAGEVANAVKRTPREELEIRRTAMVDKKFGGYVVKPGTPSGKFAIVNAQTTVQTATLKSAYEKAVGRRVKAVPEFIDGEAATVANAAELKAKYGADVALFVVDDAVLPVSLVAPEAKWAIFNIGGLRKGKPSAIVLQNRAMVEFARVFAILGGGYCSQYQSVIMNGIDKIEDLDGLDCALPVDTQIKIGQYLETHGVKALRRVPYSKACEEGWAPAPTNDVQKAVWDKVHAIPQKPLKIEFDPKRDKGK